MNLRWISKLIVFGILVCLLSSCGERNTSEIVANDLGKTDVVSQQDTDMGNSNSLEVPGVITLVSEDIEIAISVKYTEGSKLIIESDDPEVYPFNILGYLLTKNEYGDLNTASIPLAAMLNDWYEGEVYIDPIIFLSQSSLIQNGVIKEIVLNSGERLSLTFKLNNKRLEELTVSYLDTDSAPYCYKYVYDGEGKLIRIEGDADIVFEYEDKTLKTIKKEDNKDIQVFTYNGDTISEAQIYSNYGLEYIRNYDYHNGYLSNIECIESDGYAHYNINLSLGETANWTTSFSDSEEYQIKVHFTSWDGVSN